VGSVGVRGALVVISLWLLCYSPGTVFRNL